MEEALRLLAADGYPLAAVHHAPRHPDPAHAVLVCPGGGIPARLYRRFAAWLADSGIPVLRFDYRGIGGSRPESLRGFEAGLEDWADRDCAAAIDWLRRRYPDAELLGVAHSIGGLILAGAPNAGSIGRFLLVGAHTGYWRDYHPLWRLPMALAWHAAMPALARLLGYFPGRALGLGEDLPAAFACQWARRLTPAMRPQSERAAAGLARLQRLEGRALALSFTDDGFAT
ncbi:MAG: alpha/beta fold hydrolase, partial [Pseudomonadota bacterium]